MPKRRLSPNELSAERGYFTNLKNIPNYHSLKPEYEVAAIQAVSDALDDALAEETQLIARLAKVRDIIAERCTELVDKNDGAVTQVAAQFGEDSSEYQALGRTRKSERSTARKRKNNSTPNG